MNPSRCFPPASNSPPRLIPRFGLAEDLLPHRRARLAARRRFVDMKLSYMELAARIPGDEGQHWQRQVRGAQGPAELLALQCDLLAALPADEPRTVELLQAVQSHLERLFPDTDDRDAG